MFFQVHMSSCNPSSQPLLSLGTLVPNSSDRHEKQLRPDFTRHKTHPKIRFVWEKQTEVHF